MEHSKTPWSVNQAYLDHSGFSESPPPILDADGKEVIAASEWVSVEPQDLRRIAACVNYCEGLHDIEMEYAAKAGLPAREHLLKVMGERDKLTDDYRAQSLALQAAKAMQAGETERADKAEAQLAQHVTEWLCDKCNTVHPTPTGFNHSCKTPNCDGLMRPSSPELRRVEYQRDQLAEVIRVAHGHLEMASLEISHSKDVEIIRAALAAIEVQSCNI